MYDPNNSPTVELLQGASFDISYGDGSFANGPVVIDSVDVGGATVQRQAIGIPNQVSDSFIEDVHSSGLVGLSFSKINTIRPDSQKTFFDNIAPDLSSPVFTASLKTGGPGAYEFGNIDESLFQGDLTEVVVDTSRGFWEFESRAFAVGDQPVQERPGGGGAGGLGTAIADTGTSLILMDDEIVASYYEQVDGAFQEDQIGGFVFPCDSTMPDLQVAVGSDYMALIPGENMNFARAGVIDGTESESSPFPNFPLLPFSPRGDLSLSPPISLDLSKHRHRSNPDFQSSIHPFILPIMKLKFSTIVCFGGIQSNEDAPLQILGDVFFKSQFVAFNHGDVPSLGLALHS